MEGSFRPEWGHVKGVGTWPREGWASLNLFLRKWGKARGYLKTKYWIILGGPAWPLRDLLVGEMMPVLHATYTRGGVVKSACSKIA